MTDVSIPIWLFWSFITFFMLVLAGWVWTFAYYWLKSNQDKIIFIDKNNRWSDYSVNLKGMKEIKVGTKSYILSDNASLPNVKGKILYIFSENNPMPLKIEHKKAEWLDSDTLMSVINNEIVQDLVKPTNPVKDMIFLLGGIGGIIAGLSCVILLLIETGVITI